MGHAIDRAKERWEIELTKDDLRRVSQAFAMGDWRLLHLAPSRDGCSVVVAKVRGLWLPFVLNRHGYVVTTLDRPQLARTWPAIHAHRKELKRLGIDPDLDADQSRERNAG